MKFKIKRILAVMLVFCMMMGMVPMTAFAEESEPEKYDVWVAGTQVTSANASDVLGDGAASYDPATNTLTVNKNITATGTTQDAIYAKTGADFAYFNVIVADGVTLSAADGYGIYAEGNSVNLTAGDLTIDAADCAVVADDDVAIDCDKFVATGYYGIYAYGSVNLTAGDVTIVADEYQGIYGEQDVTIECADLTITSDNYYGIYADEGSVNLKAGDVTIKAAEYAIYADFGDVGLKAEDVTIEADVAIYGFEDVTVDCNQFEATGDYGIYTVNGFVNLTAEDVTIKAAEYAIHGDEDVTVDCNQFEATGDYGIYADGSVNLKAGDVTIKDAEYAIYADFGAIGLKAEDVTIEADVAIYGFEGVTVDCGKFEATGDYGIYTVNRSVNLTAEDVIIKAAEYAIYSDEDATIDCDTLNIISGLYGIYVYDGSIIIKNGTFDIQSTDASEDEADYHALYFTVGVQFPEGATVIAATKPNDTFVPYLKADNAAYDHVKIGAVEEQPECTHENKTLTFEDAAGHWYVCPDCENLEKDIKDHEFEDDADTTCDCGYVREIEIPACNHPADKLTLEFEDGAGHWYVCECGEYRSDMEDHEFEDDQDASCDCGFEREIIAPAEEYTVKFDSQGGSAVESQTIEEGGKVTKPADPTKEGFEFVKWTFEDKDWNFENTVTGDMTLVAVWKEKEVTPPGDQDPVYGIVVNNGAAYAGAGAEITAAEEGTKITLKADAAPEGKEFDKWVVNNGTITLADATKAETTFDMPAERVQVTATYKDKVVTPPADDDNDDNKDDVNKPSDDDKEDESKPSDTNKPATDTESPKTGDTSNIFMWFAVLFVSGFALVGFVLFGRKRRA